MNNTLKKLIKLNNFKWVNKEISSQMFPDDGRRGIVELLKLNKNISTDEAVAEIKKQGFRPATIYEFLEWGKDNKKQLKDKWVGILGSVGTNAVRGQCVAYFYGTRGYWNLHLVLVKDDWSGRWCFAVSRELEIKTPTTLEQKFYDPMTGAEIKHCPTCGR